MKLRLLAISVAFALLGSCNDNSSTTNVTDALAFNKDSYTLNTITVDGKSVSYRAYTNLVYIKNPVDPNYQYMNIYVPTTLVDNQTAPIFFPNFVGGYRPAKPLTFTATDFKISNEEDRTTSAAVALSTGYIVASAGARGNNSEINGVYTGKAPAGIVDLKAAVRYLRYNDAVMPGSSEKIISNGTSAGGAMSALLGSSGNNPLFEPYLKEAGAADAQDHVFAASVFCPIIDLENADSAYEWLYNRVNMDNNNDGAAVYGFDDKQMEISGELMALYPSYLHGLGLRRVDNNQPLTTVNMEKYISSFVLASAQEQLDKGVDLSDKAWLTVQNGKAAALDINAYLSYVGRWSPIKNPPAFDWLGNPNDPAPMRPGGSFENSLFGTHNTNISVYTDYAADRLSPGATVPQAIKDRVYLMNPMNFIGKDGATLAKNWYIRHGTKDRDTAFTVPVNLYTKLMNTGQVSQMNFKLGWERPHSGDYDLNELFSWMGTVTQ